MAKANLKNTGPTHKKVLALSRTRLAGTSGHVVIVEAGKPTRIPAALFLEAIKCGCVDYNPAMIKAFNDALVAAAAEEEAEAGDQTSDEEEKVGVAEINKMLMDAVRQVLIASETSPEVLTAQGMPRVPVVRAAFDNTCAELEIDPGVKVTSELVEEMYLRVQEQAEAVEHDVSKEGNRYPADLSGLGDGEVGGVTDELLERATAVDDID